MTNETVVKDEDTDSLSILPMAILPFDSVTLRGMAMVKNHYFESAIQLYKDSKTGAGHISPDDIRMSVAGISAHDLQIISHISKLHSFDVYSLRIALRAHGIKVNDTKYLRLSPKMQKDLEIYVRPFTARLIRAIYGADSEEMETADVGQLLRNADPEKARKNLKMIASKIQIDLSKVPQFLEDYGDIYLSISYYRNQLQELSPEMQEFFAALKMLKANSQMKGNPEIAKTSDRLEDRINKICGALQDRFTLFSQSTEAMWNDMSAEKFEEFKSLVEDNHAAIGALLCKLSVKMYAWHENFPSRHTAGPKRMADFLVTDMRKGF
ncbi:MAG: hypothetical protein O2944_01885 [Proteobacteria bacterium]|nr:hypothetical protein [Pseudomonadota bacterium]